MSWSKLRKSVESLFADHVRGRLGIHTAVYGSSYVDARSWLSIDGEQIVNMPGAYDWEDFQPGECNEQSRYSPRWLEASLLDYRNLSIDEILRSDDSLIRALGMLDRRVGKRRLAKMDLSEAAPLVKYLYLFRCEAENTCASIPDEREQLRAHLNQPRASLFDGRRDEIARLRPEAVKALSQSRKHNLSALIPRLRDGEVNDDDLRTPTARAIHAAFRAAQYPDHLFRLLKHAEKHSVLLESEDSAIGVIAMATEADQWLRPLEAWAPGSYNARRQSSSLARHLWASYDVPLFMDQAWTRGTAIEQGWFRHVGLGKSVRTADGLLVPLTKNMAHHFIEAPPDYSFEAAFRWAQVHALGGDRRLADALRETRCAREFRDDEFWLSVIRFFIRNPMLDTTLVNPIVDYIWNQRFEPVIVFVDRGIAEEHPPEQPNFTMRGRTVESLLRAVAAWHDQLGNRPTGKLEWRKSDVADFRFPEGVQSKTNARTWRIGELLSSDELMAEGRIMKHCVATYAESCHQGTCSIWAMEVEEHDGTEKRLTIEVSHPEMEIRQIRGKRNRRASNEELAMIRRWSTEQGMGIADYL